MDEAKALLREAQSLLKRLTDLLSRLETTLPDSSSESEAAVRDVRAEDERAMITIGASDAAEAERAEALVIDEGGEKEPAGPSLEELVEKVVEAAPEIAEALSEKEKKSIEQAAKQASGLAEERQAMFAAQMGRFLGRIAGRLALASRDPVVERLSALLGAISSFCSTRGVRLLWRVEEVTRDSFKMDPVYGPGERGRPLAVLKPAIATDEGVKETGETAASVGEDHEVAKVLRGAADAVARLSAKDGDSARMKYEVLTRLSAIWLRMYPMKPEHEQARLREILNELDRLAFHGEFSGAEALRKGASAIVSTLKGMGLKAIVVPSGRQWDDSLSPSKFEREYVRSDKAPGTIVGVIRRGFVDGHGVAVQKALLAVSR